MILFYLAILLLSIYRARIISNGFNPKYIEKNQCNAIKGIFILIVFLRHVFPYVKESGYKVLGITDRLYETINAHIGQLLVVMFLFYSGYGVMESIKAKGYDYISHLPRRRLLNTLLNFDVAVVCFIILNVALSIPMSASQVAYSFLAWDSMGNSNWYIFVILICYLITYILGYLCFLLLKNYAFKHIVQFIAWASLVACVIVMLWLSCVKQHWWYTTILCFPTGMIYSSYKEHFEVILKKYYYVLISLLLILFLFIHFSHLPSIHGLTYNIESITFAFLIVSLTMKVQIGNSVLYWLGVNLFPLYIYQRLPMITLKEVLGNQIISNAPYMYVIACLIITILIAYFYKYWCVKLK